MAVRYVEGVLCMMPREMGGGGVKQRSPEKSSTRGQIILVLAVMFSSYSDIP